MELGGNMELSGYLDTETGEIISMPDTVMRAVEPVQVTSGFFNDDGPEINFDLVPKPGLYLTCRKDDAGGKEEILCLLTCNDRKNDDEFDCGAYEPK